MDFFYISFSLSFTFFVCLFLLAGCGTSASLSCSFEDLPKSGLSKTQQGAVCPPYSLFKSASCFFRSVTLQLRSDGKEEKKNFVSHLRVTKCDAEAKEEKERREERKSTGEKSRREREKYHRRSESKVSVILPFRPLSFICGHASSCFAMCLSLYCRQ